MTCGVTAGFRGVRPATALPWGGAATGRLGGGVHREGPARPPGRRPAQGPGGRQWPCLWCWLGAGPPGALRAVCCPRVLGAHAEEGVYMQVRLGPVHGSRGRFHPPGPGAQTGGGRPEALGAQGPRARWAGFRDTLQPARAPHPSQPQCSLQKTHRQRGGPFSSHFPGILPAFQARFPRCVSVLRLLGF